MKASYWITIHKLFLTGIAIFITACTTNIHENTNSGIEITRVELEQFPNAIVQINQERQWVSIAISNTSDFSDIKPILSLSPGAKAYTWEGAEFVNGKTSLDLRKSVKIKVVAPNHSTAFWTLSADNNGYSSYYGLGNLQTEARSNNTARKDVYQEQHNSQTFPDENCGPACAAMAIRWANPTSNITVEEARSFNKTSLAWSWTNIRSCLFSSGVYDVSYHYFAPGFSWTDSHETITEEYGKVIKNIINSGKIAIQLLNMKYFTYNNENTDYHTNAYYHGYVTHFLIIKGYRVVDGKMYAEVYDPWSPHLKYPDGKFKGEDRYYQIADFATMLKELKISMIMTIGPN